MVAAPHHKPAGRCPACRCPACRGCSWAIPGARAGWRTAQATWRSERPLAGERSDRSQLLLGRKVRGWNRSEGSTAPRLRLISFAGQSMGRRGAENKSERAVDSGAGLLLPVEPERQRAIERVTHPRRKQARPTTSASQLRQTRRTCLRRSRLIRAVRDKRESPGIRAPVRGQPVRYEARKDLDRPAPNTCG